MILSDAAFMADAMDFLISITDAAWSRVCGSQCREAFARLAFDAGVTVEDAWCEAVRHANTL